MYYWVGDHVIQDYMKTFLAFCMIKSATISYIVSEVFNDLLVAITRLILFYEIKQSCLTFHIKEWCCLFNCCFPFNL